MEESKPHVRLSATQGTPVPAQACNPPPHKLAPFSSSSSLSGFLPIRAPPTPDSDSDSDSEFNGHDSGYISSSIGFESGSESDAFVTGEEFETASERPFVAVPDEEVLEHSGSVESYELSWHSGDDPDDDDEVPVGEKVMERVMPIAQLSWESDDNDVVGSEGVLSEVEDGEFSTRVKVPGNGFVEEGLSIAPRVKVFEVEEGEEDETLKLKESLVVGQSESALEVKGVESSDFSDLGKGRNGDSVQGEWIEDDGLAALATAETNEASSVELSIEKVKYVAEESFEYCSNSERNGVDSGVEGNENQIVDSPIEENWYLENCDLSELTKDGEFENALCSDFLESITLSSLSVTLLCENVVGNAGAVQFQGDTTYGAKGEVPLKEKDFPIEQEQTSLGVFGEKISITPGVMVLEEGEERGSGLWKESLVIKQSEPAIEVNCVEGSDLNDFVEDHKRDSIQAEMIEDDGPVAAEIDEPNSVEMSIRVCEGGEKAKYLAEESIVHCPNSERDGVDVSGSSGALERGMPSGTEFGVEGNENQIQETVYLGSDDLYEATKCDRFEYALCSDFLKLITPSSNVTYKHSFGGETEVKRFKTNRTAAGVAVTLVGEDVVTGLKIEDQMAIGKRLVLAGSAGALQFEGETAHGIKLEVRLKDEDFPTRRNQSSLGLSLMKWGGGLVLTTDILSLFSVGSSKMAVHVVLNNKKRGQIAVRTSNSNQLQSALVGILSIAVSIFGIFRPRFGVQNSA